MEGWIIKEKIIRDIFTNFVTGIERNRSKFESNGETDGLIKDRIIRDIGTL